MELVTDLQSQWEHTVSTQHPDQILQNLNLSSSSLENHTTSYTKNIVWVGACTVCYREAICTKNNQISCSQFIVQG